MNVLILLCFADIVVTEDGQRLCASLAAEKAATFAFGRAGSRASEDSSCTKELEKRLSDRILFSSTADRL